MVRIYNGISLGHKKEGNTAICNNMDRPRDDHTQWSKSKTRYDITLMWNLKYDTNELIYKTEIQT